VLTVGNDAGRVERMLEEGSLSCPDCGGRLAGWGHGRERVVFGPGRRKRRMVRPRRSRCTTCRVTHMLLPAVMLARRADEAQVIGAAVTAAARGSGHRRIAAELGIPESTARRWLRRFAARAGQVRVVFTRLAAAVSADPVPLAPAGPAVADAVVAVAAAAEAIAGRWPQLTAVSPWEIASAVTGATLMAPVITARAVNANWPLPGTGG
jgi:transposase-like protein